MQKVFETIVLAPEAKQSELLKSLAKAGVNTFCLRIVSTAELAQIALERNGVALKEDFIAESSQAFLIYNELKRIDYFKQYVYKDAWDLMKSINEFRKFISSDDQIDKLSEDSFKNKNVALKKVFSLYIDKLKENNLIDEIGIIRRAISSKCKVDGVKFAIYKEFKLSPLEEELIKIVSDNNYEIISLGDYSKPLKITSYTKAFGTTNEIENILSYIKLHNIPVDQCEVVTTEDSLYSKIFSNYRDVLNFDLSVGLSDSLNNTNAGKLFYSIDDWYQNLFFADYLSKIFYASYFNLELFKKDINFVEDNIPLNAELSHIKKITFNSIVEYLGNLKISFDSEENDKKVNGLIDIVDHQVQRNSSKKDLLREQVILGFVNLAKNQFNQGFAYFLNRYTVINNSNKAREYNALSSIVNVLSLSEQYTIPYKEIRTSVISIAVGASSSESGKLLLTSIPKAKSIIRPYIFIIGLSNNYFPGGAKEDPIFLDEDYAQFKENDHSNKKITDKKNDLISLIYIANTYAHEIHLSYSTYNSETLKDQSCSSSLLDIYKKENGETKTLSEFNKEFSKTNKYKNVSFFSSDLLSDYKFGNALKNNEIIIPETNSKAVLADQAVKEFENISLSASKVETFIKCEYLFYLKYVLNLPDPVDNDMFEVMSAIDSGNLAHNLLEGFQRKNVPGEEDELIKDANLALDKFFLSHPTKNVLGEKNKREEFIHMIRNAYDMDEGLENKLSEEDLSCKHLETGLYIHGYPDKVVIDKNDNLKIIDFKTKNKVEHNFNDPSTIVQLVMYSYIIEHSKKLTNEKGKPYKVKELEYRYLKSHQQPRGTDIEKYYNDLTIQLTALKDAYTTGRFSKNNKNCRFCKFKDLCSQKEKK